jgi:hypothetical protein
LSSAAEDCLSEIEQSSSHESRRQRNHECTCAHFEFRGDASKMHIPKSETFAPNNFGGAVNDPHPALGNGLGAFEDDLIFENRIFDDIYGIPVNYNGIYKTYWKGP